MRIQRVELPLYVQVRESLREALERGDFESGRLPTEAALQERYSVSAITVRRALKDLQDEGLIYRERGRGTFARRRRVVQELNHISSWAEAVEKRGLRHQSEVLAVAFEPAAPALAETLEIDPQDTVVRLLRRRFVEDTPVTLMTNYLLAEMVPGIETHIRHEASLYRVLESRYRLTLGVAQETVSARGASRREAELLEVRAGSPLLEIERVSYSVDGRPVEFVKSVSRSDIYRYQVSLAGRPITPHTLGNAARVTGEARREGIREHLDLRTQADS
jgi:GntR family transcriptional regulator